MRTQHWNNANEEWPNAACNNGCWNVEKQRPGNFLFFFKQKTKYYMPKLLEFRRVLFRSRQRPGRGLSCIAACPDHRLRPVCSFHQRWRRTHQIGKASCRERGEISGGAGSLKKKKSSAPRRSAVIRSQVKTGGKNSGSTVG